MRRLIILALFLCLAGCASVQVQDVKYYDLSPQVVGASVYSKSTDPTGANITTVDRYLIDKDGKVQMVKQDSASATGPVAGIAQSALTSGALTAVVSPIAGALFPTSTTNVNVAK